MPDVNWVKLPISVLGRIMLELLHTVRRRRVLLGRTRSEGAQRVAIIEGNPTARDLGLEIRRPPEIHRHYTPDHCLPHQTVMTIFEEDEDLWDQAERLVYRTYREVGFCEPSAREWVEEFNDYRAGTAFHIVVDAGRVVGAMRTIVGPIDELPLGRMPITTVPRSLVTCEFGSLAVEREFRGLGITNAVHRQAAHFTFLSEADSFAMAVEPWFLDVYRDLYGIPMVMISEPVHYMGSETIAGIVFLDQMISVFIRERPNVLRWITEGLDPEIWMPDTIDLTLP